MNKQYVSREDALEKAKKYCTYQDRSHQEVWEKLKSLNQSPEMAEDLVTVLIEEGFLDEERFARSYTRGKFKHTRWGREKIRQGLKGKGVQPRLIEEALTEIDEAHYHNTLQTLLQQKLKRLSGESLFNKKNKAARYLIGKGYEQTLVWQAIEEAIDDEKGQFPS